jgi:hypothetical protein
MNDPKHNKNYAMAKGPVNRRTTAPPAEPKPREAPSVRARIHIAKAKHRLGTPLSQRLTALNQSAIHGKHPTPTAIVQVIGGTVGATGLVLGLIQSSTAVTGVGAALLSIFAAWAYVTGRSKQLNRNQSAVQISDLIDASDLERLDTIMEKLAAQVPQSTMDQLADLKESIARCVAQITQGQTDGNFSSEEHLYVREAIRRYIPDSISSCLRVPEKDRETMVIDGSKPAIDLLHDQIAMIQHELETRETRLAQLAGESLMRQQHFLAAKSSTHH